MLLCKIACVICTAAHTHMIHRNRKFMIGDKTFQQNLYDIDFLGQYYNQLETVSISPIPGKG